MPVKYSIKDLERLSGVKAHTLRIWEQRYDLLSPQRTSTNIRFYSNEDLKKILNVSLLNNHGYKISNIASLSAENLFLEAGKLLNSYKKESDQIENLMLALLDWDEHKFEHSIEESILHFGIEKTVEKIVFPFLKQLGNMWQAGIVNPAQEHFISNLIRQKIIVETDKLGSQSKADAKRCILYLPTNELHEIGLLYSNFLARKKGYRCLYLGQSVPFEDLQNVYELVQPDYIITILTSCFTPEETAVYLKRCETVFRKSSFLVSGRLVVGEGIPETKSTGRLRIFRDFSDLAAQLINQ